MKNIHILPTYKPSRLHSWGGVLKIVNSNLDLRLLYRNIYITSGEDIKIGDWMIHTVTLNIYQHYSSESNLRQELKKIILTTDQDLINNGVQAINDGFLEWFIENPSCEEVEVDLFPKNSNKLYEIIIPKEEPKQEYDYIGECNGNKGNGCFMDSSGHDCGCFIRVLKEEPKPIHEQIIDLCGGEERFKKISGLKPRQEIKLEDVFNDEKRQGVKDLIDTHKQRLEKYSERFDNDKSEIGNPDTWGQRIIEEPKQETLEEPDYEKIKQALIEFIKTPITFVPDKRMYSEEDLFKILLDFVAFPHDHMEPRGSIIKRYLKELKNK